MVSDGRRTRGYFVFINTFRSEYNRPAAAFNVIKFGLNNNKRRTRVCTAIHTSIERVMLVSNMFFFTLLTP